MKKIKLFTGSVLVLAIMTLSFVQCGNKGEVKPSEGTATDTESVAQYLPVAYVDADSLLSQFNFYNRLVSAYEDKLSKQNNSLNSSYQKLQSEMIGFQQKAQNNAFLSQERMRQEQTRIERMQQDLEKKAAQVEQELALEQKVIQQQLSDSLSLGIKEFNKPQKYQMIFTKTGNSTILYADDHYNITNEVLEFLNKRFE
ncbi:MAG: OmpH family outer membrane protein [Dysgonamonadaceae bacterium]|jgi:outer membrane protein|nr:OmpH family outer membrane protein [Dysgonamonadaceae bacterium]